MATVEYRRVFYSTSTTENYIAETTLLPYIKCTDSQLAGLIGSSVSGLPSIFCRFKESDSSTADRINASNFRQYLGIELSSVVGCVIVYEQDGYDWISLFSSQLDYMPSLYGTANAGFNSTYALGWKAFMTFDGADQNGQYTTVYGSPQSSVVGYAYKTDGVFQDYPYGENPPYPTSGETYGLGPPLVVAYYYLGDLLRLEWCVLFETESAVYSLGVLVTKTAGTGGFTRSWRLGKYSPNATNDSPARPLILQVASTPPVVPTFSLTVVGGTGSGSYASGQGVSVVAQPPDGKMFARWESSYDIRITYGSLSSSAFSFEMPNLAVTLTAVFYDIPDPEDPTTSQYNLTVINGTGSGVYQVNSDVTIVADTRPNLIFAHWDITIANVSHETQAPQFTYGGTNTVAASFKMPAYDVIFTATYVNADGSFPYNGGGLPEPSGADSDKSGPSATWDKPEEDVEAPALPNSNASAVSAGLVTMYNPSLSELRSLGGFLWSDDFISDFGDNLKKLIQNPIDCIISLALVPVAVPTESSSTEVKFGMISSGVSMKRLTNQYVEFDCGSIDVTPYTGSFLDYSPYTKYELYLPFIGSQRIDADEINGKSLNVTYHIDVLTGACVAFVSTDDSLIASFNGQCANPIPVTGANYSRLIASILGVVATGASVGFGMAAAGAIGATTTTTMTTAALNPAMAGNALANLGRAFNESGVSGKGVAGVADVRNQLRAGMAAINSYTPETSTTRTTTQTEHPASVRSSARALVAAHGLQSMAHQIMVSKGEVSHAGTLGGSAGFLGKRTPYLLGFKPNTSIPQSYGHFYGYPCNLSGQLSSFSGYTEVEEVEATAISGTDEELAEILELIRGGVYL